MPPKQEYFEYVFFPSLKIILHFLVPKVQPWKINQIIKQNGGFLFGTPRYRVVHHIYSEHLQVSQPTLHRTVLARIGLTGCVKKIQGV